MTVSLDDTVFLYQAIEKTTHLMCGLSLLFRFWLGQTVDFLLGLPFYFRP